VPLGVVDAVYALAAVVVAGLLMRTFRRRAATA